jgi:hypothetical protein
MKATNTIRSFKALQKTVSVFKARDDKSKDGQFMIRKIRKDNTECNSRGKSPISGNRVNQSADHESPQMNFLYK